MGFHFIKIGKQIAVWLTQSAVYNPLTRVDSEGNGVGSRGFSTLTDVVIYLANGARVLSPLGLRCILAPAGGHEYSAHTANAAYSRQIGHEYSAHTANAAYSRQIGTALYTFFCLKSGVEKNAVLIHHEQMHMQQRQKI
nr:hypothetical protein [uncultured Mucilaginibacter sp.]